MSKAVRRQREVADDTTRKSEQQQQQQQQPQYLHVDKKIIAAVKAQMTPTENRSDLVDVRNCILGLRECHIVAALLGLPPDRCLVRDVQKPPRAKQQNAAETAATDAHAEEKEKSEKTAPLILPVPRFFERVIRMRLQLGATVANGLGHVLAAAKLFHTSTLKRLDLSRNKFTPLDAPLIVSVIEKCQALNILCLSHNVQLKSAGVAPICEAAGKLPHLRALLLEKCAIDDTGAFAIARLLRDRHLPSMQERAAAAAAKQIEDDDDDEGEEEDENEKGKNKRRSTNNSNNNISGTNNSTVQLTLDLSHNRIGHKGLIALRAAVPWYVGIGAEGQSPPVRKVEEE